MAVGTQLLNIEIHLFPHILKANPYINNKYAILPDFRFPDGSGGLITRDFDRFTRSDLRFTSRKKVAALSGNLMPGLLVGVTQYCAANILSIC